MKSYEEQLLELDESKDMIRHLAQSNVSQLLAGVKSVFTSGKLPKKDRISSVFKQVAEYLSFWSFTKCSIDYKLNALKIKILQPLSAGSLEEKIINYIKSKSTELILSDPYLILQCNQIYHLTKIMVLHSIRVEEYFHTVITDNDKKNAEEISSIILSKNLSSVLKEYLLDFIYGIKLQDKGFKIINLDKLRYRALQYQSFLFWCNNIQPPQEDRSMIVGTGTIFDIFWMDYSHMTLRQHCNYLMDYKGKLKIYNLLKDFCNKIKSEFTSPDTDCYDLNAALEEVKHANLNNYKEISGIFNLIDEFFKLQEDCVGFLSLKYQDLKDIIPAINSKTEVTAKI